MRFGLSSLIKFNTISVWLVLALIISFGLKTIVSIISTKSSSSPAVEINICPSYFPGSIIIEDDEIVNSSLITAVPSISKGIWISFPDMTGIDAVNLTSDDEFSKILWESRANDTSGGSLRSVIVIL